MSQTNATRASRTRRRTWTIRIAAALLFLTPPFVVPRLWCGRGADAFYDGQLDAVRPLAEGVATWVSDGIGQSDFDTGNSCFDGEWHFGTYQMAALGLLQVIAAHPETRERYLPLVEKCVDRLLEPEIRAFDTSAWGNDAMSTLDSGQGHCAYLGYLNIVLCAYRKVSGQSKYDDPNDRITAALVRRLGQAPQGIIETYPDEAYPVDNCAAIASIAFYDRVTGADHSELVGQLVRQLGEAHTDPQSGLLYQAVDHLTGEKYDKPRASGTALGAYFMSFGDMDLSRRMYAALRRSCAARLAGFAAIREYPPGTKSGQGDIDSGPVVLGLSFSGTGFTLATARINKDRELYKGLYRLGCLVGAPINRARRRTFVCGGPLGNSIMLAMLTAGGIP